MQKPVILVLVASLCLPLIAQEAADKSEAKLTMTTEALGDNQEGVVTRVNVDFKSLTPPEGLPLEIQGSVVQDNAVVRNFRYQVRAGSASYSFIQTFPVGDVALQIRLLVPVEGEMPIILSKLETAVAVEWTKQEYVASVEAGAEAIFAEGIIPETAGAISIRPPKRDLAPNLFIVEVDVKKPVRKVEFWVEGKKVFTRNGPPYRAELDLGALPRRVVVKVLGFDRKGRYIDGDAWVVNERDNPVEAKITKHDRKDGQTQIKVSVQNNDGKAIQKVLLDAAGTKLAEWSSAPFAILLPTSRLAGIEFVTAIVLDVQGKELASDLLFLDGDRYFEEIQVNLIELPVTVVDGQGNVISDLTEADFEVYEQGEKQELTNFGFASNLPLSIGVLVDHSGSMQPRIDEARTAALRFFESILRDGDKAFFGGFSWEAHSVSPFLTEVVSLRGQVGNMPDAEGGTALYDSLVTGLYRFRSIPGRKALVVMSDGEDTVSRLEYKDMIRYVQTARVPIYFIGLGMPLFGGSRISSIVEETGAVVYMIKKVEELDETYTALEKDLRSQYLVSYYSESTKSDGAYRKVEVRVKREGAVVRTIRGYIP